MSLAGTLAIANGALANINRQLAVVSQNVANASTPGYSAEISTQYSLTAEGVGLGVRSGATTRNVDTMLQGTLYSQNASVAGLQTQQTALQAIDSVQGTPGEGTDLGSLYAALQNQFSTLLNQPDNQAQQSAVVSAASQLASGINTLSNAYTAQRQTAQDSLTSQVTTLNNGLATIGGLSQQIESLKAAGASTADLENQRDVAVGNLSQLLDVKVFEQPNGDLLVTTTTGLTLPTQGGTPFTTSGATIGPNSYYPGGGIPAIKLGNTDITSQLQGGQIGANITLRDKTLPTYQAELDELAQNTATRFAAQGLTLFTDPTGAVPAGGGVPAQNTYVGFASEIQVNPAVLTTPSAVRDGTPDISGGLAGFTGIIDAVLNNALGAGPPAVTLTIGLGPAGTLSTPYAAPATIGQLASTILASQAQDSASSSNQLASEQALQTTVSSNLSSESGVNMDVEMSNMIQLQNAYGANAKIIAAVQSMWTQLLNTVS